MSFLSSTSTGTSTPPDSPPDSDDLHAHFDAQSLSLSDGDSVSTWDDESGNGNALTAGTAPTYRSDGINGNPVVEFNGTDEFLDVSWSAISQPVHVFLVFRVNATDFDAVWDGESTRFRFLEFNGWNIDAGDPLPGGSVDTDAHIQAALFDGGDSTHRIDASEIASGPIGTNAMDGLTMGGARDQSGFAPVEIGEMAIYPMDKSGVESEAEQYFANRWGIAI